MRIAIVPLWAHRPLVILDPLSGEPAAAFLTIRTPSPPARHLALAPELTLQLAGQLSLRPANALPPLQLARRRASRRVEQPLQQPAERRRLVRLRRAQEEKEEENRPQGSPAQKPRNPGVLPPERVLRNAPVERPEDEPCGRLLDREKLRRERRLDGKPLPHVEPAAQDEPGDLSLERPEAQENPRPDGLPEKVERKLQQAVALDLAPAVARRDEVVGDKASTEAFHQSLWPR